MDVTGTGKNHHQEKMAEKVINYINNASFGGKQVDVFRRFGEKHWIFNDIAQLREFLSLSKSSKVLSNLAYTANRNSLLQSLHITWGLQEDFHGKIGMTTNY